MTTPLMVNGFFGRVRIAFGITLLAVTPAALSAQTRADTKTDVTFTRDIAPILQDKCQACHRAGEIAPMSLVTYNEVRPWVRAMKAKVTAREMPPWYLDKTVGIQKYKNDASLSDAQIDLIARWADAGAPQGDPKDMPPP